MVLITQQQIDFFRTFGFIKFPGLMKDSIDWITKEFEQTFPEDHPHDGSKRTVIVPFIDQREKMCTLLDDPSIEAIASAFLGEDFNYLGSDGNYYVGNTPWHRDGFHNKYKFIKIAFYLDSLNAKNGALRIIPGSYHLNGEFAGDLDTKVAKSEEYWGINGEDVPSVVLDVEPGDVVVFNINSFHASFGGNSKRRMFTICMTERYAAEDLQMLRDFLVGNAIFKWDLNDYRNYTATMMNTATPQRMKHLEQIMANDAHLQEVCENLIRSKEQPWLGHGLNIPR
jgi:hypothetical protein